MIKYAYFPLYFNALKAFDVTTAFIACYDLARWSNPETPLRYRKAIYNTMPALVSRSTYNRKRRAGIAGVCSGEYIPIYYELCSKFAGLELSINDLVLFSFICYRLKGTKMPFLIARKGDVFGDLRANSQLSDKQYLTAVKHLLSIPLVQVFYTQTSKGLEQNIILIDELKTILERD